MNKAGYLLTGMGIGAGMMFMLDPDRGRRRRALVRDKSVSAWRDTQKYADKMKRDIANRSRGIYYEAKAKVTGKERKHRDRRLVQENWSPAARVLASAVGGGLAIYGFRRGGILGKSASAVGLGLLTRGVTNEPIERGGPIAEATSKVASAVSSRVKSVA